MNSLMLATLRFLPVAVEHGLPIVTALVAQVTTNNAANHPVEDYARRVMEVVPNLLAVGVPAAEVIESLVRTNAEVGAMAREGRGPTDAEWSAQGERIRALENRLDMAARKRE